MPREAREEELERWKLKYFDSLADSERQEKALASLESLFYRLMGRLALTGYGASPELDKILDQLRQALRAQQPAADIDKLVEQASRTAERAGPGSVTAPPGVAPIVRGPRQTLLGLIDQLGTLPGTCALRKRVEQAGSDDEAARRAGAWLAERLAEKEDSPPVKGDEAAGCVSVLHHLADAVDAVPAYREKLQRLLAGQHDPLPRGDALRLVEKAAAALNAELARSAPPSADMLHAALIELVRALQALFDDNPEFSSLEASLTAERGFDHQVTTLDRLAKLVAALRDSAQAERVGIESFLGLVTDRLREIEVFVDHARSDHQASKSAGETLGDNVTREVQDLRDTAGRTSSVGELRETLNHRLARISSRVVEHLEQERKRSEHTSAALARMDQRLRETQGEAGRLQRSLDEERARAAHDSLTGVWNRGAFDKRLEQEVSRSHRGGHPLALMFLDIDRFKRLNDSYGHQAGDRVLASVAKLIGKSLRNHDFPARYGGEEFVVLMPDSDIEQAMVVAERVRTAVARAAFRFRGEPVRVTLSAGVSELKPKDEPAALLGRADRALYEAKESGRNRCVSATA